MEENKIAVNTDQSAVTDKVGVTTTETQDDAETRIEALEAQKAQAIEEASNYKLAFLKEKRKNRLESQENDVDHEETSDEKIERVVNEKLLNAKITAIDTEKEVLLKKVLKENKELKLAQINKATTPPASIGSHNEFVPVTSTVITQDQLNAFKAKGWSDKDIERYKKNLSKNSVR